jgi:tRNA(Ile)-lysidine synthase
VSARPPVFGSATALSRREFDAAMVAVGPWEGRPRLAAAVSGGSDSLALACLAAAWAGAHDASLTCLIVDHGLRAGSGAEAEQVRSWLAARGIDAALLRGEARPGGSIQERARALRYRLLIQHCIAAGIPHLLLAHHRDDQAETVLMRLVRGSGLRGLAGMAPASLAPGSAGRLRLLRPLLGVPKARLAATLEGLGQAWIEDPSNRDLRHERVRWRRLMPLLEAGGGEAERLAGAAHRLGEERRALDHAVASWLAAAATPSPFGHVTLRMAGFSELPAAVAEAALARLLAAVGGGAYPPARDSLRDLSRAIGRAPDRLARTLAGCVLSLAGGRLQVVREPSAVAAEPLPAAPGPICWDGRFELRLKGPADGFEGLEVGPLGRDGLAKLRQALREQGAPKPPAPARQLLTIPALWRQGRVAEVPHLPGFFRSGVRAAVSWAPRQPLTG